VEIGYQNKGELVTNDDNNHLISELLDETRQLQERVRLLEIRVEALEIDQGRF